MEKFHYKFSYLRSPRWSPIWTSIVMVVIAPYPHVPYLHIDPELVEITDVESEDKKG